MKMSNLTATLYGINDLRVEEKPIPEPKSHEVLLKMGCVGICGSDVHYYTKGRCGDYILKEPMVIGHEASGTVDKVGCAVTSLQPGDRVAVEPGIPCMSCKFCKIGRYNICPDMKFCATPPVDGNLRQYYCHAADFCFKLPPDVSLEEGSLLEPLSVGVHACKRGGVTLGSVVLITGGGPIGLVTCLAAKAMGASKILVTGTHDHGLEMVKQFGADLTLKVNLEDDYKEVSDKIICTLGEKPNITIDCAGTEASISCSLVTTEWGGVLVLIGFAAEVITTPLIPNLAREIDIRGIFRYANDYPVALAMISSGKVDATPMITHQFDIRESVEAFETAREMRGNPIKIMLHCNKTDQTCPC